MPLELLRKAGLRRDLLRHPALREPVRWAAHAGLIPFKYLCGSHFGTFRMRPCGLPLRYVLGPNDSLGDLLFWQGAGGEGDVLPRFAAMARAARGILDIGANTGLFTLIACAANPSARVIAWEPVPYLHEKLKANVAANRFDSRCELRRQAVSDTAGLARLYIPEDTTMASLNPEHVLGSTAVEAVVETVDDAVDPAFPVDLVKIDVETFELQVLRGMRAMLDRSRPAVFLEILPTVGIGPIQDLLNAHGYRLWALTRNGPCAIGQAGSRSGFNCNYLARFDSI